MKREYDYKNYARVSSSNTYGRKVKIRRKSLAVSVLKGIGIAGLVLLAATSPYFGLNLIRGFKKHNDKKRWRKFYASINYLDRRGYVKIIEEDDRGVKVKITHRGEDVIKQIDIESLALKKQDEWDGKWRVIIFDVPVSKNKNRLAFTEKIKQLGFIMVQKSVWAYPFECYEELMILRKFYEIQRFVTYMETVEIEDELEWRRRANLKNP